jgi:tRNA(His) guanylyltransferase
VTEDREIRPSKDSLGDRMKRYEDVPRISLTPRMPMVIRVDGRAFHTYTRAFDKPWSHVIRDAMTSAAIALMEEVSGAKFAYLQSDEISLAVTDDDRLDSQAWFGKGVQKICSVAASIATVVFNDHMRELLGHRARATFDARCWVIPREDLNNYYLWRQRDATRNSVFLLGQAHFSHKALQGKSGAQIQDMLMLQSGVNWNDLETWKKRGWGIVRRGVEHDGVLRHVTEIDWNVPIFSQEPQYIKERMQPSERDPKEGE